MIVLDASTVVELVSRTTLHPTIAARLSVSGETLHAPQLLSVEVVQALRRFTRTGVLSSARGALAIEHLGELRVTRYSHEPLLGRVWELRRNLTAYDAVYVALAEALRAPLLTLDARIARAPGHSADIEVVAPDVG